MKTGAGFERKYKNRRVSVFIEKNGTVYIKTKRLRTSPREPVIVRAMIAYRPETFSAILSIFGELLQAKEDRL